MASGFGPRLWRDFRVGLVALGVGFSWASGFGVSWVGLGESLSGWDWSAVVGSVAVGAAWKSPWGIVSAV